MGYYAHSERGEITIHKKYFQQIVEALTGETDQDIEAVFGDYGFSVYKDTDGDVSEMYFEHDKWHGEDTDVFLDAIAPYIEKGSVISFCGEDDCRWAYYFDGVSYEEYEGDTYFPDMPGEQATIFHHYNSVAHNLNELFGDEKFAEFPKELIAQMQAHPEARRNSFKAIVDVLFECVMSKDTPTASISDLVSVLAG